MVVGAVACAALGAPAVASANDFQTVYNYYKKHGTIRACVFSNQQLRGAENQTPPDVEQYAPSFLDAVSNAREQSGNCNKKAAAPAPAPSTPPPPTPSTPTPAPSPTASTPTPVPTATVAAPAAATTPAPTPPAGAANAPVLNTQRVAHTTSAPAAIWLLAVLGGLALLAVLSAAAAWWYGWAPPRVTGPSFTEFGSWLRLGD